MNIVYTDKEVIHATDDGEGTIRLSLPDLREIKMDITELREVIRVLEKAANAAGVR